MSNETELRGRLSQIIDRGLCSWDSDTNTSMTDTEYAAQTIIDNLGLEVVSDGGRPEWKLQIVGKWEKQ